MTGQELRSFSHFDILTLIAYTELSRNLENWLILRFVFIHCKLWKSVKKIKLEYKYDLQVFSWWIEKNYEDLVLIKFWPRSHTQILAENLKIDQFWSLFPFSVKLWKSLKMINSNVNMIYKCSVDEWNRIKKI